MNRRTFIKRMGQLCGLPALAAIAPLPAVLNAAGIQRAKKVLDAQVIPIDVALFDAQLKIVYRASRRLLTDSPYSAYTIELPDDN